MGRAIRKGPERQLDEQGWGVRPPSVVCQSSGRQGSGSCCAKRYQKGLLRQDPGIKLHLKPGDGEEGEAEKISRCKTLSKVSMSGHLQNREVGEQRTNQVSPQLCGLIEMSPVSPQNRNHHSAQGPGESGEEVTATRQNEHRRGKSDKKTPLN